MSINLEVIPTSPDAIFWGELKQLMSVSILGDNLKSYFGISPLLLKDVETHQPLESSEELRCPGYYYFDLEGRNCTLSMLLEPTPDSLENAACLDDYGENIIEESRRSLQEKWERIGYSIDLASHGGRPPLELDAMMFIANCLAKLTEGVVVVHNDDVFDVGRGIYDPFGKS